MMLIAGDIGAITTRLVLVSPDTGPRTPGADGDPSSAELGYLHCGPDGVGLRKDGSQRHRVRDNGVLCRRAEHPQARQYRDDFAGRVSDPGEGRRTPQAAIDDSVPAPVISAALFARFGSRDETEYADRLLPTLRFGFGGHLEKPKE